MPDQYKRVLVTGGAGCIGMPVCRQLLQAGCEVVLFDLYEQIRLVENYIEEDIEVYYGSVLDDSSIRDAIRGCDAVIHLAAYLGVRRTEINNLRCLDININGTKKVLNACGFSGVRKIVFASSSEVYGEPLTNPVKETDLTQGKTVYAISKLAGEELVRAYSEEYNQLNYSVLRYFNTYGPYQIAQFVIPKFIRNVLDGKPPVVYGKGDQKRSYCFSEDTARGTVSALYNEKANGQTLNIGNSEALITLKDLAELVIELCGKEGVVKVKIKNSFEGTDRSSNREISMRYCDTGRASDLLDFAPIVSLREGIQNFIDHGVIHPKWATSERDYTIDDSL